MRVLAIDASFTISISRKALSGYIHMRPPETPEPGSTVRACRPSATLASAPADPPMPFPDRLRLKLHDCGRHFLLQPDQCSACQTAAGLSAKLRLSVRTEGRHP